MGSSQTVTRTSPVTKWLGEPGGDLA